jgi:hypothetical protein
MHFISSIPIQPKESIVLNKDVSFHFSQKTIPMQKLQIDANAIAEMIQTERNN